MPYIRYVCISDMHLGEEDSLLTNLKIANSEPDPAKPSPVMEQLVECLRYLISKNDGEEKPTLILNGDILELALTTDNQAAMAFSRLIELIMPPVDPLFGKIIYIPGNHDHHLWESARETQYVNHISKLSPKDELKPPWHTTNIFVEDDPNRVPSYFLTSLVQRYDHLKKWTISIAYPNFGLLSEERKRCIIFHHGHFIEPLYQLISTLKTLIFPHRKMPSIIWDIEAENFAWIDFFWSTMGRSGEAGKDIELIYEKMQDPEAFKKVLSDMVDRIEKKYDLPGWDWLTAKALKEGLYLLVDKISRGERSQIDRTLSEDSQRGLRKYMNGPVRTQIINEFKKTKGIPVPSPDLNFTFIFGHTHKPFQEDMNFGGYEGWVNVYNSGGWVVETVKPEPLHGGAVVLIDEDLNATSIRMYNESNDPNKYQVNVREATHPGEQNNVFHNRISGLINPAVNPWKDFSNAAARAISVRAQNLEARIYERG